MDQKENKYDIAFGSLVTLEIEGWVHCPVSSAP